MKQYFCAAVTVALMFLPASGAAQDTEWNRYTLEGLAGVHVRVEADSICEANGLTPGSVRAEAETALIESPVELLTEPEMLASPGLPELRITIECTVHGDDPAAGVLAYAVSVRMQQAVQMIRDTQITLSEAVTWYATTLGAAPAAGGEAALRSAVTEKLGEFLAAYEAANADEGGG